MIEYSKINCGSQPVLSYASSVCESVYMSDNTILVTMAQNMLRYDLIQDITSKLEAHSECQGGCIIWIGAKAGHSGYGNIRNPIRHSFADQPVFVRAHRLAYATYHDMYTHQIPKVEDRREQLDVSHLCHRKLCIPADHLILEPHSSNLSRHECKVLGTCTKNHPSGVDCIM